MRLSKWIVVVLLTGLLGACASWGEATPNNRMSGKNARMHDIAGEVIRADVNWWGSRYIIVQDRSTGARLYVQSDAAACVPGKPFWGTGHLTRVEGKDYTATFHFHLTDADKACQ